MWKRVRRILFGACAGAALTSLFVEVIILWEVAKSQRLRGDDSLFIFMLSGAVAGFLVGMWDSFRRPTPTATPSRRRALGWLAGVSTVAAVMLAGFCATSPACRYAVIGLFNGEPRHDGLCRSFWAQELTNPNANRRGNAAYAFGFLGPLDAPTVLKLCMILRNPYEERHHRYNAAVALRQAPAGDPEAIAALTAEINAVDSPVRYDCCETLFRKVAAGQLDTLSGFLSHPDRQVQSAVGYPLGELKQAALPVVPALLASCEQHFPDGLLYAMSLIGKSAPEPFVGYVREYLRQPHERPDLQFKVGDYALGGIGRPYVPLLIELFSDPNATVRANAVNWLNSLPDDKAKAAMPALKKLVDDPSEPVRGAAELAAERIEALQARRLNELMKEPLPKVAEVPTPPDVVVATPKLTEPPNVAALIGQVTSEKYYEAKDAIKALGDRGPDAAEAVPALKAMAWRNFWDGRTDRDLLDALNRIEPGSGTWIKWRGYLLMATPIGTAFAIVFLVVRWLGLVCYRAFLPIPGRKVTAPSASAGRNPFDDPGNDPAEPNHG